MKPIAETVESMFTSRSVQEDEYLNEEDGLIYCSKCHTPRQHKIQWQDKVMLPNVRCQCQQEEYEKQEAERKRLEFLELVSRLKANGLQDKALREYTFANDEGYNPEIQKAHDYVAHWSEMKAKSIGLLLWGNVGTGKSFFAGCIANALLEEGVPVLMTNFSRILNSLSGMYSDEKNQFIDSLNKYSLLIIDDLGIERSTEFALEQVFNVIDSRYRSKLPLIVTTNMTLDELKHPQDLARSRIYDRVLERCVPLKINNQNIRQRNAAENMKEARKILESGTGT
jgi:DNA replication protein DnaC